MMRLLSIGIDCVSAAIFVIPALAILQCTIYRKWEFKPFCVKLIFAFYAIALFSVVGVPAVGDLIFQDVIKRRDAVRGNHDEAVAIVVNFADFAFLDGLKLCHSKTLLFLV